MPSPALHRREFLLATAVQAFQVMAASRFDRSRLSVLSDEIGTPDEAIAFCRQYRLKHIELRLYRFSADEAIRAMRRKLDQAGLRVSFLNTPLLKFIYPGTTAVKSEEFYEKLYAKENLTPESMLASRMKDLDAAVRAAKILGVPYIRGFTFWRTSDPGALLPKIAGYFTEMQKTAASQGVFLCVENEFSTNTATTPETLPLLERVPGLLLNWDPQNAVLAGETVTAATVAQLPVARVANVQLKADGLIGAGPLIDWKGIFAKLAEANYKGCFGLETHTFVSKESNLANSHTSMKKMIELVGEKV